MRLCYSVLEGGSILVVGCVGYGGICPKGVGWGVCGQSARGCCLVVHLGMFCRSLFRVWVGAKWGKPIEKGLSVLACLGVYPCSTGSGEAAMGASIQSGLEGFRMVLVRLRGTAVGNPGVRLGFDDGATFANGAFGRVLAV